MGAFGLQVQTSADNDKLTQVLQRLVDEHGKQLFILHCPSFGSFHAFNFAFEGVSDRDAAPMLDALAAGFRECKMKPIVGAKLQMDNFLDSMLRRYFSQMMPHYLDHCIETYDSVFIINNPK